MTPYLSPNSRTTLSGPIRSPSRLFLWPLNAPEAHLSPTKRAAEIQSGTHRQSFSPKTSQVSPITHSSRSRCHRVAITCALNQRRESAFNSLSDTCRRRSRLSCHHTLAHHPHPSSAQSDRSEVSTPRIVVASTPSDFVEALIFFPPLESAACLPASVRRNKKLRDPFLHLKVSPLQPPTTYLLRKRALPRTTANCHEHEPQTPRWDICIHIAKVY